jgi:hypothetical protein
VAPEWHTLPIGPERVRRRRRGVFAGELPRHVVCR